MIKQIGHFVEPERYSEQIGKLLRRLLVAIANFGKICRELNIRIEINADNISLRARDWYYQTDIASDNMIRGKLRYNDSVIFNFNVFPNDKEGWCLCSYFAIDALSELAEATKIIESQTAEKKLILAQKKSRWDNEIVRSIK